MNSDMFCEQCYQFVPTESYAAHVANHVNGLKKAQDKEYEDSVIADLQRAEEERVLALQQRLAQLQEEEERAMQAALAQSKLQAAEG